MKLSYVFGLACISLLVGTPTWAQQEPTKDLLVGTPTRAQQEPMKEMTCRHPKNWKPTDDELQRVLSEHRQWAKKQHYEPFKDPPDQTEGRANLCNADLSNAELNKANLAWAVLNGANLDEAKDRI